MNKEPTNKNPKINKVKSKRESIDLDMASSIINNTSDGVIVTNPKGEITFWNNGATRIYKYSKEEILGKNVTLIYKKENILSAEDRSKRVIAGESFFNDEIQVLDKYNNTLTVLLSLNGLKDKNGKITHVVGISKDITEQKLAQQALEESEYKFSRAFDNSPIPVSILDLKTGKRLAVNNTFCKTFGYTKKELVSQGDLYKQNIAVDQKIFKSIVKKILNEGRVFEHPFSMFTKSGEVRETLVNATRVYPDNNDVYVASFLDVTDRKKVEYALSSSEIKFRNLAETAQVAIAILEEPPGSRFLYVNPYWEKLTGYSSKEAVKLSAKDLVDPDFHKVLSNEAIESLSKGKATERTEFKIITKSGEIKWIKFTATNIEFEGQNAVLRTGLDITVQKNAEQELWQSKENAEQSEKYLNSIINNIGDPVFVKDYQSRLLLANDAFCKLFELSRANIIGRTLAEDVPREEMEAFLKIDKQVLETGKESVIEETLTVRGGKTKSIYTRKTRYIDNKGKKYLIGVIRDITDLKNTELELKKAQEIARLGSWYLDISTGKITWSDELYKMYGFDPALPIPPLSEHKKFLTPESWELLNSCIENTSKTGNPYSIELRTSKKEEDDAWQWMFARGEAIFDSENNIVALRGTAQDITDRKKAEEVRLETLSRLNLAINTAELGVWSRDAETDELIWNDRLFEIYGISPDEFESNMDSFFDRLHPDDRDYINEVLGSLYEGEPLHDVKFRIIRPDNEIRYIDSSAAPLVVNGRIEKYIGINRDITERKIAEEKLYENEKVLKAILDHHYQLTGLLEPNSKILAVNKTALSFIGKKEEDVIGKFFWDTPWWDSSQKTLVKNAIEKAKSGQFVRFETTHINKLGEKIHVDFSLNPVFDDHQNVIYLVPEGRDITERIIAEEKIKENEASISAIINSLKESVCVINEKGDILQVNETWKEFGKANENKMVPAPNVEYNYFDVCRADKQDKDASLVLEGLAGLLQGSKKEFSYEYPCHGPDKKRWFLMRADLMKTKEKQIVISHIDITNRKLSEEKIKESEERYRNLIEQSLVGIGMAKGNKVVFVNEAMLKIWKYDNLEEYKNVPLLEHIAPDYRELMKNRIKESVSNLAKDLPSQYQYDILCKDGEIKTVIGHTNYMQIGEEIYAQTVVMDLTERIKAQEKIKETLAQLNLAVETAKLGVWSHEIKTGKLEWNGEHFKTFGIKPSEFDYSNESFIKMVHPEDLDYLMEQQEKVFQKETIPGINYRIIRPSGEVRYIYASATPIFDNEGNLIKMMGINMDVTESKIAEKKLAQANAELIDAVSALNELKKQLEDQNIYLKRELDMVFNFQEMVYGSAVFSEVLSDLERVAPTDATVLILGESGTGKELLARALHNLSLRNKKPFIKVNCSAIPTELIESELFGHKKGSFTGAVSDKIGKFELADGGTLFLDEIGDLPLAMQPKLLRFLQEGEMEVVGGTTTKSLDVRIVAATNKNLKKEVEKAQFREDLYFRLNVFPIQVPPLRERKEDIPLLVEHFVDKFGKKYRKEIKYISESAMKYITEYNWPGNIRELENLIERAVILSDTKTLILPGLSPENGKKKRHISSARQTLNDVQRNHILSMLEKTNWKIDGPNGAAVILDIKPSTFRDKMKKLGIKRPKS